MTPMIQKLMQTPVLVHLGVTAIVFAGFRWVQGVLDASYAASGHPVDYATGQTTFDAQRIKGFYAQMSEAGTLDIYRQTQIIDFGFIAGMILLGVLVGSLVARFAREESIGRKVAIAAGAMVVAGAVFDVSENLISFVMLSRPVDFANWIAIPYSVAASIKFGLIGGGMLCLCVAVLLIVLGRTVGKPRLG